MRLIIAGSRNITAPSILEAALDASGWRDRITEVVCGCAPGVDTLGEQWAIRHKIPVRRFPADWDKHGRAAGPIRNREMAMNADALLAIWDGESHGTSNIIAAARQLGLQVRLWRVGAWQEAL